MDKNTARLNKLRATNSFPEARPDFPQNFGPVWFLDDEVHGHTGPLLNLVSVIDSVGVELGSFLGRSTNTFLRICPNATIICVDTWQGSQEHQNDPHFKEIAPTLFERFSANLWEQRERIIPVRTDTATGIKRIAGAGIEPDWIYIDADHSTPAVMADILICVKDFPDAKIIGDDWLWPSVKEGVEKAAALLGKSIKTIGTLWWLE